MKQEAIRTQSLFTCLSERWFAISTHIIYELIVLWGEVPTWLCCFLLWSVSNISRFLEWMVRLLAHSSTHKMRPDLNWWPGEGLAALLGNFHQHVLSQTGVALNEHCNISSCGWVSNAAMARYCLPPSLPVHQKSSQLVTTTVAIVIRWFAIRVVVIALFDLHLLFSCIYRGRNPSGVDFVMFLRSAAALICPERWCRLFVPN